MCMQEQPGPSPKGSSLFMTVLSAAIIWPLRALTPVLAAVLLWTVLAERNSRPSLLTCALLVWAAVECGFWVKFRLALQRLQHRHTPPRLTPQQRAAMFSKVATESEGADFSFLLRWFPGASSMRDVGAADLRDWAAWAFFGVYSRELQAEEAAELDSMVQSVAETLQKQGTALRGSTEQRSAPGVGMYRLNLDPVRAKHRPLVYYLGTAGLEAAAAAYMYAAGFRRGSASQHMQYYLREPSSGASGASSAPALLPPLVFVHGVGMGLATYISFVAALAEHAGTRRRVLLIELPHVSMKLGKEDVPSMECAVATCAAILEKHKFGPALWVGHSLGSCVVAAVVRARPQLVHSLVLIDPVCFLLWEVDVLENFCYRPPSTAMQRIQHYHISMELYISHYFKRHFWWYECVLFPSDIPAGVPLTVFASAQDGIVNSQRLRAYLRKHSICLHEFQGQSHGGWLLRPKEQARIISALPLK